MKQSNYALSAKPLVLMLVLALALTLAACSDPEDKLLGSWELDTISANGISVDADSFWNWGGGSRLTFEEENKVSVAMWGSTFSTTYTLADGQITFEAEALKDVVLTVGENALTMTDPGSGSELTFVRAEEDDASSPGAEGPSLPEQAAQSAGASFAPEPEQFSRAGSASGSENDPELIGSWTPAALETNGVRVGLSETGAQYNMYTGYQFAFQEDGNVAVTMFGQTVTTSYTQDEESILLGAQLLGSMELSFSDGTLTMTEPYSGTAITFVKG